MTLAINTTDAFATGTISNTGLGSRGNKSFATGFQGELIQISIKERLEIDARESEAKKTLLAQGIEEDFDGSPKGFPKTKVDFQRDKFGNLVLQNNLPVKQTVTSWYDIRHMIARNEFVPKIIDKLDKDGLPITNPLTGEKEKITAVDPEGNPILDRKVSIVPSLLEKSLFAAKKLKAIGIDSIAAPKYRPGTTIIEAYDQELKNNTQGITAGELKKQGLTLSNFPRGTIIFDALKMVESESNQGVVDPEKAKNLVKDMALLRAEELFTLKRFKSFGGTTPSKAVELLNNDPEKYRPTPAEKLFKPIWKTPPPIKVDLGKISSDQWRAAVIKNAQKANPAYTEEEIITKFGFDRVVNLGSGWFGRER